MCRISDMIDCDCQGSQLGVSLRRAPNAGLHRPLVTLAGFVCLGRASKTRRETLAFLMSGPDPVLVQDAGSLSSEQHRAETAGWHKWRTEQETTYMQEARHKKILKEHVSTHIVLLL